MYVLSYNLKQSIYKRGVSLITIYIKKFENDKIESIEKFPEFLKKIIKKIIKKFNILQVKKITDDKKIYLIPQENKVAIYKNIIKKLKREKTKTEKVQVVLSKEIKKYEEYFKDIKILDGRKVFFSSIESILNKILKDDLLEFQDVYILTNLYIEKNINLIRNLAPKVKIINIITKEIDKFCNLESMLDEWGLQIVVSNNKRKSLKKAKIIINLDFTCEELNQYIINRNAVIINLSMEKITNLKAFEGIIIQDIRN